jgi:tetratricopeptide (TPR) repeat protein
MTKKRKNDRPTTEDVTREPLQKEAPEVRSSRHGLWVMPVLVLLILVVYHPVRHHGFALYDDIPYVAENTNIQGASLWQSLRWGLTTSLAGYWMPLTWASHAIDVHFFGLNAGPQHVTNVVFHILNTLLLFVVLRSLTGHWKPSAFVAAMFAVHPLNVEPVAWIAERKGLLSTFFLLLTLWAYTRYARQPRFSRYLLVALFFALGLMAKPILVTVPIVLLLLDIWPLGRLTFQGNGRERWMRLAAEKVPLLAMSVAVGLTTLWMSLRGGGVADSEAVPIPLRFANAVVAYASYIRDGVWPMNLAAFYPLQSVAAWQVVGSGVALVGVSALVVWSFRRLPYLLVGWLWYVLMLVPVIGLVQAGGQARADRFVYVPMIGLFIAVAWGVPHLIARWGHHRIALWGGAGLLVLASLVVARRQVVYWESASALWGRALAATKNNHMAHTFLGLAMTQDGRVDEGINHYREALRIQPRNSQARINLGVALAKQQRFDEAIPELEYAVKLAPQVAVMRYNLGFALANQGRTREAMVHYAEAVRLKPDYVEAFTRRGDALLSERRFAEAISDYTEALRLQPRFVDALLNMGIAFARQGRYDEAIAYYGRALEISPNSVQAYNNVGTALANQGRFADASAQFNEALRIQPNDPVARQNLNLILEIQNRKE